ncbi:MAG: methionine--tRNA ligase, partial [Candidatus Bathyarchaeota archaeon]|nr:methionine--tRNA ligase [Candidatus Bathyarchaeota archaeon]
DEHGTPIELEAIRRGVNPKQLTDENHKIVKKLFLEDWQLSFDNYTRTESPIHKEFVQKFFLKVYKNGYIFDKEEEFPYCPRCQHFLPDRFIQGICPRCQYEYAKGDQCENCGWPLEPYKLVNPVCVICGEKPVLKKTRHWYFNLSEFSEKIRSYIENNDRLPANAKNFSLNFIKEGLKPRPLTRDNKWGIPAPFPGAEGKTIYVWMEAVLGYLSATIEYFINLGKNEAWKDFWLNSQARSVYFIGKDNIPFHTIILPALLLASEEGYNLPWTVESTEFLLFKGQKFSKSRRIGVWIDEAIKVCPADYWRYSLVTTRPEVRDTSFTWDVFLEKVNSELNDTLGNLIHRVLTFIFRYFDGFTPEPAEFDEDDLKVLNMVEKTCIDVEKLMENFKLQATVLSITGLARLANKYINDKEPWKTIKTDVKKAATTGYVSVQVVKALTTLLYPIMPQTCVKILSMLNLKSEDLSWKKIFERIPANHRIGKPKPVFKKLAMEIIEKELGLA